MSNKAGFERNTLSFQDNFIKTAVNAWQQHWNYLNLSVAADQLLAELLKTPFEMLDNRAGVYKTSAPPVNEIFVISIVIKTVIE